MKIKFISCVVVLLLACCMFFSLAGCGGERGTTENSGVQQGQSDDEQTQSPDEPSGGDSENQDNEEVTIMYMHINGNRLEVALADNNATKELIRLLGQGDIVYTADDYGGFEKVGALGHSLPTSNSQITTQPGDVMLYLGNQIVIFYGNNSWSYTPIGRIQGHSLSELRDLLGAGRGEIQVRLSLN